MAIKIGTVNLFLDWMPQSKNKMTVPILIATLRGADYMNFDMGKIYMMITVAIVPIIIVYLLLSKYIIAGVTLGGVKE